MPEKLQSRKFWICLVAFFGSIATSVAALQTGNEIVQAIGVGAGVISGAASAVAYVLAEASVDAAAAAANQTVTTSATSVTATSASQKVVESAFSSPKQAE